MPETSANEFRKKLKAHVDQTIANHQILKVKRKNGDNFVVIGEKDWRAIEETLYLNQFAGLVDSIQAADREPLEAGTTLEDLAWYNSVDEDQKTVHVLRMWTHYE